MQRPVPPHIQNVPVSSSSSAAATDAARTGAPTGAATTLEGESRFQSGAFTPMPSLRRSRASSDAGTVFANESPEPSGSTEGDGFSHFALLFKEVKSRAVPSEHPLETSEHSAYSMCSRTSSTRGIGRPDKQPWELVQGHAPGGEETNTAASFDGEPVVAER